MKRMLFLIAAFSVMTSCEKKMESNYLEKQQMDSVAVEVSPALVVAETDSVPLKTTRDIKTAQYRIEVDNIDKSTEAIEASVEKYKGIISSENLTSNEYSIENKITIRVPNPDFEKLMREIAKQAVSTNFRNISSQDVSGDFVEIESRLKTKKEDEKKYAESIRKLPKNSDNAIYAEEEIRRLHEETEAQLSRLNYLKDQVAYSTIHLELFQKAVLTEDRETFTEADSYKFKSAFSFGWSMIKTFVVILIYLWPIIIATIALLITRKHWKGWFSKKEMEKETVNKI